MDVLAAYREVGSFRGAAEICGTTHKTVRRIVERHDAGGVAPQRRDRRHNYEVVRDLVAERVRKSHARRAQAHQTRNSSPTEMRFDTRIMDSGPPMTTKRDRWRQRYGHPDDEHQDAADNPALGDAHLCGLVAVHLLDDRAVDQGPFLRRD